MAATEEVVVRRVVDFSAILGERNLICASVGANPDPFVLSLEQTPDYRVVRRSGSFSKNRADQLNCFRIHYLIGDVWNAVDIRATDENYHFIQPLGKEQWVVARSRAEGDKDQNAHIIGPDGSVLTSFHAGDGIQDVQATERGEIWISYFDEGVFGDTELGRAGLVCLDQRGRPTFQFTNLKSDRPVGTIADCYALNVCSSRETWLYYYTDFPLVRLVDGHVAGCWTMSVEGSSGFAVDGDRALFGGSYDSRESLFLCELDTLAVTELKAIKQDGTPLKRFRAFGRKHHLYLGTQDSLYLLDMKSLSPTFQ
jgi:hypothetical protein